MIEDALEHFSVCQLYVTFTVLWVTFELAFIVGPLISKLRKIFIIELSLEWCRLWIVDSSLPVELIIVPVSFVGNFTIFIIKFAETVHFIIFPFTFIMSPVLKIQSSMTVLLIIAFVALILPFFWYLFFDKLEFNVLTVIVVEKCQMGKSWTTCKTFSLPRTREIWNERRTYNWTTVSYIHTGCWTCKRNTWYCETSREWIWPWKRVCFKRRAISVIC